MENLEAISVLTPFSQVLFFSPSHISFALKYVILLWFQTSAVMRLFPSPAVQRHSWEDAAWRTMSLGFSSRTSSGAINKQDGLIGGQSGLAKASPFYTYLWPGSLKLILTLCPISWLCTFATSTDQMQDTTPPHEWGAGAPLQLLKVGSAFPPIMVSCPLCPCTHLWVEL